MKKNKKIPEFKSEKEESDFWSKNDSTEYIDWNKAEKVLLPDLKPSTKSISLRLPEGMLYKIKMLAHKRDIPYQSLIKMFLQDKIDRESV